MRGPTFSMPWLRPRLRWPLLAGLVLIPVLAPSLGLAGAYQTDILRLGLYMAALAATWSLLAGIGGQFSFGHVAIAGLGAYAGTIWSQRLGHPSGLGDPVIGIAVGTVVATGVGALLGLLLDRLRGAYLALFTLAFAVIAHAFVIAESDLTGGAISLAVPPLPGSDSDHYYLVLAVLLLILGLIYWLLASRPGLLLRAMREDADAAMAMGANVPLLKLAVFTLTSAMVGLAASVYYHTTPRIGPDSLDLLLMSQVLAFAVIGGIESPLAGAIAAVLLTLFLENIRTLDLGVFQVELGVWRFAIFGALLVLTLRFAPRGLLTPALELLEGKRAIVLQAAAERAARSEADAMAGSQAGGGGS